MTYEHFYSKLIYCNNLPIHNVCKNILFRWHGDRDFTINKSEHILRKNLIGVSRGRPPSPRTNYFFYFMEFFGKFYTIYGCRPSTENASSVTVYVFTLFPLQYQSTSTSSSLSLQVNVASLCSGTVTSFNLILNSGTRARSREKHNHSQLFSFNINFFSDEHLLKAEKDNWAEKKHSAISFHLFLIYIIVPKLHYFERIRL